jgi:hypothetical protein
MTYSKKQFAHDLREKITRGYDISEISRWSFQIYLDVSDLEPGINDILIQLGAMDTDPQFELSKTELLTLISELEKD